MPVRTVLWIAVVWLGVYSIGFAATTPVGDRNNAEAPAACEYAALVLKYVLAFRAGDTAQGVRDPTRIRQVMTPECRRAVKEGKWPALARTLLSLAAADDVFKYETCEIAPPEALLTITDWEKASPNFGYDTPCAVALLRGRPADFEKIVVPRLIDTSDECRRVGRAAQIAERLHPEERGILLPTLEAATATRAQGRDSLYTVVCKGEPARSANACHARPALEGQWAKEARFRRAVPESAFHAGLAFFYGLACFVLWFRFPRVWPATAMGVLGTAGVCIALAWLIMTAPTPGAGALNVVGYLGAMIATPAAALAGALIAWAAIRVIKIPALAWCLAQVVLYPIVTIANVWSHTGAGLC